VLCMTGLSSISKAKFSSCGVRRHAITTAFISVAVSIPTLVLIAVLLAEEAMVPYCFDLRRATELASSNERFTSISARARDGNFAESALALMDWSECSVYAGRIFTCDSQPTGTTQEAQQAQERISREVLACLGTSWAEAKDRSSLGFVVLHHVDQDISMTLSIDETEKKQHVVRLILFGWSN
jgi:hypothetical protein